MGSYSDMFETREGTAELISQFRLLAIEETMTNRRV